MPAPRVVLDTNVFVSALLGKGSPAHLYESFIKGRFWLIISHPVLSEVAEVLTRPRLGIDPADIKTAFRLLRHQALIVHPRKTIKACRDPKDNMVLECAVAGNADFIVTGDRDLLVLDPFRGVRIISPAAFSERLGT